MSEDDSFAKSGKPDIRPIRPLYQALGVAARGWPVFPCSPDDKRPLVEAGFKSASTDPEAIRSWWAHWPEAMIGIPTGEPIGAFVVDLDPKAPATAEALLGVLESTIGEELPPGPRVRTPRGGLHLYFAMPPDLAIGNRAAMVRDAAGSTVDVRGSGGYVIVPDSVRHGAKARKEGCAGKAYLWEPGTAGLPLPAAPQALLDLILKRGEAEQYPPPQPSPASRGPKSPEGDIRVGERAGAAGVVSLADERQRKYALSALDAETREVASAGKGGRNHRLNQAAYSLGQLCGAGLLAESLVAAALENAAIACGLAKEDGIRSVRATIRSGMTDGARNPRDLTAIGRTAGGARPPPPDPLDYELGAASQASPAPSSTEAARGSRGARVGDSGSGGGDGGSDGGSGDGDGSEIPEERLRACAAEPLNDTGNGRRLLAHFGADMLNVREIGPHAWSGSHWDPEGGQEAFQRFAQMTAERIALEAVFIEPSRRDKAAIAAAEPLKGRPPEDLTDEDRRLLQLGLEAEGELAKRRSGRLKFAISCGNSGRITGMIAQAGPHMTVPPDALDAEPLAINLLNGTLRLVKEPDPDCPDPDVERLRWAVRLDPHRREDRIAKLAPVAFDPAAACPAFDAFLERFQPHEGIRRFLMQFHGYALTGLMGEQVFVFNHGLGANGKSTFMETIARLMGSYAQLLPAEALTGDNQRRGDQATPEFARLPGARLVRCAELPRGQGFRENTLKLLTGGEPILVRHLHARFFDLRPSFKAIGSGNDKPNIGGVDEGIWRRMKLVPWEVTIPVAERRPMEKVLAEFAAEAAGILNRLLAGLLDYLENGLVVPAEVQAATESYRADMDPVGEFARACVVEKPGDAVTAREMFLAYTAWCHANSVKPYAEKTFAVMMTQKGFQKTSGRIRKYINVALDDVPDDPEASSGRSHDAGSFPP